MKRKLLLGFGLVVVLVIAVFGYAAYNADKLVAAYKPDIERIMGQTLGSVVRLGDIDVSVFPSVNLRVDEVKISADDHSEGFSLKNLLLKVALFPLLTGSLDITTLRLEKPVVTFLKDAGGVKIEGLGKGAAAPKKAEAPAEKKAPDGAAGSPIPKALKLNLNQFEISEARIVFKDLVQAKEYAVTDLSVASAMSVASNAVTLSDLKVRGQLLGKAPFDVRSEPITFNLADGKLGVPALAFTLLKNVINVAASVDSKSLSGNASIVSSGIDLASLDPLLDVAPAARTLKLGGAVEPKIEIKLDHAVPAANGGVTLRDIKLNAGPLAVSALNGVIAIKSQNGVQEASTAGLKLLVGEQPITVDFSAAATPAKAALQKLDVKAFGGTVDAHAEIGLADQKALSATAKVAGMKVDQVLAAVLPGVVIPVEGTLRAFSTAIAGSLAGDIKSNLTGNGALDFADGKLRGINIAAQVLNSVRDLPFLKGSLQSIVPPGLQRAINSPDTGIQKLTCTFQIGGSAIRTSDLHLVSDIFTLDASGTAGFDANLNLKATITFTREFTQGLVSAAKDLSKLTDDRGQLVIPLVIQGVAPKLIILPNIEKLIELAGKKALQEGAGQLLNRALGGKGGGGFKLPF